ncbi:MAG: RsmE family RNA methyltransferase, partial [Myxococcota bacterium]|nr:RsmE family RNA methyltransferase [Myxococcota bacterium]
MSEPRRLYAPSIPAAGARLELDLDAARHVRVLRLRAGDRVVLFDGRGLDADAVLEQVEPGLVTCAIERLHPRTGHGARVVLVQALPKGSKLEEIVRAATEAGATAIHLAIAERSIARPDEDRARGRLDRLSKIAQEAARQSERAELPAIVPP